MAGHSRPKDGVASARLCPAMTSADRPVHDIAGTVDKVLIVAGQPIHDIETGTAIENVVASVDSDRLVERIAGQIDRREALRDPYFASTAAGS
jgi:hypothetical protein